MALSDLILNKGEVIVILSSSYYDIVPAEGGKALSFGSIQRVSDLSDYTVGNVVMFDIKNATPFMIISGQTFYIVNEENIRFTEPTPP